MKMVQITGIQSTSTPAATSNTTNTPLMNRYGATFLRNLTTSGASQRRYSSGVGTCWPYDGCCVADGYAAWGGRVGALGAGAVFAIGMFALLVNAGMRPVSSAK